MSGAVYLIDANSLIEPHHRYYPFDFAPGFWGQMEQFIRNGKIAILDLVKKEILNGTDSLTEWMENLQIGTCIDRREPIIIAKYQDVLQHIQSNPRYQSAALTAWSKNTVADPWLIAAAITYNYTLVTFETSNTGLNDVNPSKNAKIPDVAKVFEVKTINLFQMMRELEFQLR